MTYSIGSIHKLLTLQICNPGAGELLLILIEGVRMTFRFPLPFRIEILGSGKWRSKYLQWWQNCGRVELCVIIKWVSLDCPWKLKQLPDLQSVLDVQVPSCRDKASKQKITLHLMRTVFSLCSTYQREKKGQWFYPSSYRKGKKEGCWLLLPRLTLQVIWKIAFLTVSRDSS